MGKSNHGWLNSSFHFSFAEYFNPSNVNFGVLRVLNDDLIEGQTGFDTHPHENMEIVSYVIDGELTHKDSMGNKGVLTRGNVQYMSAGTGVYHSEYNNGNEKLRLLQIWIVPDKMHYEPNYGDHEFKWEERENKWLYMVSGDDGNAPIKVHQDINMYSLSLEKNNEIPFNIDKNRQAYLVQIEGKSSINSIDLNKRDAMEIVEEDIRIKAKEKSHILVIEMKKSDKFYL